MKHILPFILSVSILFSFSPAATALEVMKEDAFEQLLRIPWGTPMEEFEALAKEKTGFFSSAGPNFEYSQISLESFLGEEFSFLGIPESSVVALFNKTEERGFTGFGTMWFSTSSLIPLREFEEAWNTAYAYVSRQYGAPVFAVMGVPVTTNEEDQFFDFPLRDEKLDMSEVLLAIHRYEAMVLNVHFSNSNANVNLLASLSSTNPQAIKAGFFAVTVQDPSVEWEKWVGYPPDEGFKTLGRFSEY